MAVKMYTASCLFLFFVSLHLTVGQTEYQLYQVASDCTEGDTHFQYFSTTTMSCRNCPQNKTFQAVESGLRCVCNPGYRYLKNFGNENVECEKCPGNQIRSEDGFNCVECPDIATCANCTSTSVAVEREVNGNLVLAASGNKERRCQTCAANTKPNAARNRCERCNNILAILPNATSCTCAQTQQAGEYCFRSNEMIAQPDFTLPLTGSRETIESTFLRQNLVASYLLCNNYKFIQKCQQLSNMCVLTFYFHSSGGGFNNPCNLYKEIAKSVLQWPTPSLPWLYYFGSGINIRDGDRIIDDDKLTTEYTFDPKSTLQFRAARYALNGTYLGISNVDNGRLQLCTDTAKKLDAAYTFGTYYSHSCSIPALDLWDKEKYPLEFFDMYLEFTRDENNQLYYIPVKVNNLEESGDTVNTGTNEREWQFTRRFFLVDNVATTGTGSADVPEYVRYAKNIEITIELYTSLGNGRIFPPYISVTYDEVSYTTATSGAIINPTFTVTYTMGLDNYRRNFQIATGTLSTLGVLYAGYKTWVWSKRAGRLAIDFASIGNFMFFVSGVLSNVFFIITFGIAFYFMVFFKRQSTVYLFLLEGKAYNEWLGLFGAAFALKCLQIIHLVVTQCMVDVFFVDWEKPKPGTSNKGENKKENPVSIWRTYFVANEWNELQTTRKINQVFQIFAVVFFLNYVGFENVATKDPNGQVVKSASDYQAAHDPVMRYAIGALVYLLVAVVQWLFYTLVYERFISDKVRDFVDLCAMSNISVFIMQHAQYGYYIHGRSVHGRADTDMREMCEMIKREEDDLCGKRGLEEDQEEQTFVMSLPRKLRLKYEEVLLPVALENVGGGGAGAAGGKKGGLTEKQVEAYNVINKFLSSFINHSLKSIDYVVKDKSLLESIMDTEFLDSNEQGIFYKDNGHSFDQCLFYGNEVTLLLFDLLLFVIVDLIAQNFVLAGIITYLFVEFVAMLRDAGAKRNLAKKTLVDERFLI